MEVHSVNHERIELDNDILSACVLPERGGKTASLKLQKTDFELLSQPSRGYPELKSGMRFSDGDASGFDDVFPSMGEHFTGYEGYPELLLPDHGEVWSRAFRVRSVSKRHVRMETEGSILPYHYEKEISLSGNTMKESVLIRNTGDRPFPWLWVCHCLMRLDQDTRFAFPVGVEEVECLPGCTYPSSDGLHTRVNAPDLTFSAAPPAGHCMKCYVEKPVRQGVCRVLYPSEGIRAEMRFDPGKLPYLGFWITTGAYRGEANFAFEPASGYYDTWEKALESGTLSMLEAGRSVQFEISISINEI